MKGENCSKPLLNVRYAKKSKRMVNIFLYRDGSRVDLSHMDNHKLPQTNKIVEHCSLIK